MAHHEKQRLQVQASEPELKPEDLKSASAALLARHLAKTPTDQSFDMWLQQQLHAMYEIASE